MVDRRAQVVEETSARLCRSSLAASYLRGHEPGSKALTCLPYLKVGATLRYPTLILCVNASFALVHKALPEELKDALRDARPEEA